MSKNPFTARRVVAAILVAGAAIGLSACATTARSNTAMQLDAPRARANDESTLSFPLNSSTYTVKPWKSDGPHRGDCEVGYYVRSGPPQDGDTQHIPQPSVTISVSNGSSNVSGSVEPTNRYSGPFALYRSVEFTAHSHTPYTHTYTFSWTCDKVPSWGSDQLATTKTPNRTTHTINPIGAKVGDLQYVYLKDLKNDGPAGLVVNNKGDNNATGNPVIGWPDSPGASNQRWILTPRGTKDNIPTYSIGLWQGTGISYVQYEIGGDNSNQLNLIHTGGGTVDHGVWQMMGMSSGIENPPGSPALWSVIFVNTTSGRCLAGAQNQGDQLTTQPCDTDDASQYWTLDTP